MAALKAIASAATEGVMLAARTQNQDLAVLRSEWECLLSRAYSNCAAKIVEELGPNTEFQPVYPNAQVQEKFLTSLMANKHKMTLSYHGTRERNIMPISRAGLLKPGTNGVKVANGSVHGVGIYTARLGAAGLSRGFCDSDQMFVCAVSDTSKPVEKLPEDSPEVPLVPWKPSMTYVQTRFPAKIPLKASSRDKYDVKQKSDEMIHVGDAIVVFEESHVAPVFTIKVAPEPSETQDRMSAPRTIPDLNRVFDRRDEPLWEPSQQVGRRRAVIPDGGEILVRPGRAGSFKTTWLSAVPLTDATSHERTVKRHRAQRARQTERQRARRVRQEELGLILEETA
jgi:hypothetical protein